MILFTGKYNLFEGLPACRLEPQWRANSECKEARGAARRAPGEGVRAEHARTHVLGAWACQRRDAGEPRARHPGLSQCQLRRWAKACSWQFWCSGWPAGARAAAQAPRVVWTQPAAARGCVLVWRGGCVSLNVRFVLSLAAITCSSSCSLATRAWASRACCSGLRMIPTQRATSAPSASTS